MGEGGAAGVLPEFGGTRGQEVMDGGKCFAKAMDRPRFPMRVACFV